MGDKAEKKPASFKGEVYDWMQCIVMALVFSILLFVFIGRIIGIIGPSMKNTLFDGDRVIMSGLLYTPEQGDVVILTKKEFDSEPIVKRVIAVGGQQIDMDFSTGEVWVDGEKIDEPYIREQMWRHYDVTFPLNVPEGFIFVMGDNRNESLDSRYSAIGLVDVRCVLGKVYAVVTPFSRIGAVH